MAPVNADQGLVIVPAGAGAGKTHRIKTQLSDWVKRGIVRPERILAVTFTEAAAGELRERIRAGLLADGLVAEAMAVERAYVSTIHGLGLRLLTEHALAAGASPAEAAQAELSRADHNEHNALKIARVGRLAAAAIEEAMSGRRA